MMYLEHFGLVSDPFSLRPHLRFLYDSTPFEETMSHLVYGLENGEDIIGITGEIGTGKTMALHSLLEHVPATHAMVLVNVTQLTFDEMLKLILEDLDVPVSGPVDRGDLVAALKRKTVELQRAGRRVLLVVDEAQNLDVEALEGLRLLTNIGQPRGQALQIILSGQPGLSEKLDRPELAQLKQRIRVHYHLDTLDMKETREYVDHRLSVAGSTREIFSAKAFARVHELSGGVPRLVNIVADRALLAAFVDGSRTVEEKHVERQDLVRAPGGASAGASAEPAPDPAASRAAVPGDQPDAGPDAGPDAESDAEPAAGADSRLSGGSLAVRRPRRRTPIGAVAAILTVVAVLVWIFAFGGFETLQDAGVVSFGGQDAGRVAQPAAGTASSPADPRQDADLPVEAAFPPDMADAEPQDSDAAEAAADSASLSVTAAAAAAEIDSAASVAASPAGARPAEDPSGHGENVISGRPDSGYYVHVGSFLDIARAERLRGSLAGDLQAIIWIKEIGDKTWNRVFVGPYPDQDAVGEAEIFLRGNPGVDSTLIHRIR